MHRSWVSLIIVSLAILPLAAAVSPAPSAPAAWRWGLDHARYAGGGAGTAHVAGDIACGLGDVNADGAADLLLRTQGDAGGQLRALAGPAYDRVLWTLDLAGSSQLRCAPDTDLDGIADPVLEELEAVEGQVPDVPAGVDTANAQATLHALAGATGQALVELSASETARTGAAAAAAGSTRTDVSLEPGSAGVYLFVASEETTATASLVDGLSLSSAKADVRIEIIDASGKVTGTIEAVEGAQILAHAVVADARAQLDAAADTGAQAAAKARVLVLSATEASPIQELPAQVPTIAAHDLDGSVLWEVQLDATTDAVMLLPRAGDINGDTVEDLIVQAMPTDVGLDGVSSVTLLSGLDGSVLLSEVADGGFLGALPLGDLTPEIDGDAEALLVVTQESADALLKLKCVRDGAACWSAELAAAARPVNGQLDAFTGDLAGFVDLNGDAVADLAVLVEEKGEAMLQLVSGVDGSVVWSTAVDATARVHAVPGAGGADLAVVVQQGKELALSLVDGVDGSVTWTIEGDIAAEISEPDVDVASVTGRTGEVESLLLTVREASAPAAAPAADPTEHVYELDPATGDTRWSGATNERATAPPRLEPPGTESSEEGARGVPAPAPVLAALAVLGAALLARWMRRAPKA